MSVQYQAEYQVNEFGRAMHDLYKWTLLGILLCWLIIPLFVLLIKWFQFLLRLKNAADSSQNKELKQMYLYYFLALLAQIVNILVYIFMFIDVFNAVFTLDLNVTDIDAAIVQIETITNNIIYRYTLPIGITGLIYPIIFVISYIAFDKFAQECSNNSLMGKELRDGGNYLKIGSIIAVFSGILSFIPIPIIWLLLPVIGFIFQMAGLNKGGKGLQGGVKYQESESYSEQQRYHPQREHRPQPPQQEIHYTQTDQHQFDGQQFRFCPNCGKKNLLNARFCISCGNLLK
ncbi:MAG: zinc ribbon domain-containing protein [Promethearchaeota archaeon]